MNPSPEDQQCYFISQTVTVLVSIKSRYLTDLCEPDSVWYHFDDVERKGRTELFG